MSYRNIWWDPELEDYLMNTKNPDGTVRDLDWMCAEFKRFFQFKTDSSELHNWEGSAHAGLTCTKCGSWVNTWHTAPTRGCTPSRPELSTAMVVVRRSAT